MTVLTELGLSSDEETELLDLITTSHAYRLHVELRDRDEEQIDSLTGYVTGGQIDIDVSKGWNAPDNIGRTMTMRLFDPERDLNLTGRNLLNRAIAVDQQVQLESRVLGDLVSIPQGRFDIIKADIEGPWINVTCVDKRARCKGNLLEAKVLKKGTRIVDAILIVLHEWVGIPLAQIALPSINDRLPADYQAHFNMTCWQVAVQLAASIGYLVWPTAGGTFQMRQIPTTPDFGYTPQTICGDSQGTPGFITVAQSLTDSAGRPLPNTAVVNGHKTQKGQPPLQKVVYINPLSPISKETLAVGDVDYLSIHVSNNPNTKDPTRLVEIGQNELDQADTIARSFNWNAVPVLIHEEWDCVSGDDGFTQCVTNVRQASAPVTTNDSATMSVGALKRLSYAGARAR